MCLPHGLTLLLIQHCQDVLPRLDSTKAEMLPRAWQLLGGALLQDDWSTMIY